MKALRILMIALAAFLPHAAQALTLSQEPLFIASTEPRVMLLLSRDHELSKKAYTDYSDLDPTPDGVLETTYKDSINYYGYFDSNKCYSYSGGIFQPVGAAGGLASPYNHQCSGQWSGNFLNWATMTRMDVVRKVLYGGYRSTDNTGTASGATVLERHILPNDVHAFSKVFAPVGGATDMAKYTPYSTQSEITLCNVTDVPVNNQLLGTVNTATYPPLIKVASGSWPQWAMSEITQCIWREQKADALTTRPTSASSRLTGSGDLVARVAVCVPNMLEDNCKSYFTRATPPVETVKPTGLLQKYGDVDSDRRVRFGLITGSYNKNTDGGVLRKNIKLIANNEGVSLTSSSVCGAQTDNIATTKLKPADDEIDVCTGQFIHQGATDKGIIKTLNSLRIADWKYVYSSGLVGSGSYSTCSASSLLGDTNNTCRDWGNPLSEMYYEALRYFAGKTGATSNYATTSDSSYITGLQQDAWDSNSDPLPSTEWCAISNIITLSTGLNSLDGNRFEYDITNLASSDVTSFTNSVGVAEGIAGNYYIGSNGTTSNSMCSAKSVSTLDSATGICPEIPHMKGGYKLAGLAYSNRSVDLRSGYETNRLARWTGINSDWVDRQPLNIYQVALAENLPTFSVSVGSGTVSLVPACRSGGTSSTGDTVCSLTDLRVEAQTSTYGRFLASWEDGTAGSDYDMDAVSRIEYRVVGSQIFVTVSVVQAATGASMKLGYTITGTNNDGTHFLINIQSTGDGGSTCSDTNKRQFSLIPTPSYGVNCSPTPATSSCPAYTNYLGNSETLVLPTGVVSTGSYGCVNPDGTTGSNCGCPKSWTYTQGTTAANLLKNPLWYAAKYGAQASSWDLKNNVTGAATPDGEPDNFFDVRNPADLYDSLADVFDAASQPDAAASSVATNSTNLQVESRVFQAKFSSADWSGQLLSYKLSSTSGVFSLTREWDASDHLDVQDPTTGRVIITKGTTGDGELFAYGNLTPTQKAYLDQNFLGATDTCGVERAAYLRGVKVNEGATGAFTCASSNTISKFRPRSTSVLGDIINSSPWYVGGPRAGFSDVDHPGYAAFRTAYKNRLPVVYVAGNDGMLHGFDASLNFTVSGAPEGQPTTHAGNEVLAYVPSAVYPHLSKLTDLRYNKNHRYFVDGSPMVGDADLDSTSTNNWRTVLIGALGAGGKGYYALDITDPGTVDNAGAITAAGNFSEANAADRLLWEFDETDMGYAYNMPPAQATTNQAKQIVKMANGKWAAIVGNGYNSASGYAVLYILFIEDGINGWISTDYVKIVADTGGGNGLSTPVPIDTDGDGSVDTVYAGDLKGRMWKFLVGPNLVDNAVTATPSTWKIALSTVGCTNTCTPLFDAGTTKPIIWPAEVTLHPNGGQMVLFGTGKYLESTDNSSTDTQTIYGVWDNNAAVASANLVQQSVASVVNVPNVGNFRTTSTNSVDYAGTDRGWYLNLPTSGERMTGVPKLDSGLIFFNTFIPSTSPCDAGGTGWFMGLDYLSGKMPSHELFDTDGDGDIDSSDTTVSGFQVGAVLGGSTLINSTTPGGLGVIVSSKTSGAPPGAVPYKPDPSIRGRITWREIVQ